MRTIWLPPTEAQWEQQIAHPHPGAGTCFYANLRRRIWVRVDADGFPVVRADPVCLRNPPGVYRVDLPLVECLSCFSLSAVQCGVGLD